MLAFIAAKYQLLLFLFANRIQVIFGGIYNEGFVNNEQVVVFAIKQLHLETVNQRLMVVSDPLSVDYGRFWTKETLNNLTSNPEGILVLKRYFRRKGVKIVHETLHGEYLVALGSIALWESLLGTNYEYTHNTKYTQAACFQNYTLDKTISDYVSAVFGVCRLPRYNPQLGKRVYQQSMNTSLTMESAESIERSEQSSIVSLWREHDCTNPDEDKNRPM